MSQKDDMSSRVDPQIDQLPLEFNFREMQNSALTSASYGFVGNSQQCSLDSLGHFLTSPAMISDPWSRPTMDDLRLVLESIGKSDVEHARNAERLELSVPAEIQTIRGNSVSAMTREISRFGIGMLHRGYVTPGDITVRMASETRQFEYRVKLEWCMPCDNGMFISGGRFLSQKSVTT